MVFIYKIKLIQTDFTLKLCCENNNCQIRVNIKPTQSLKDIIAFNFGCPKFYPQNDPKIFDINTYDMESFESYGDHICRKIEEISQNKIISQLTLEKTSMTFSR